MSRLHIADTGLFVAMGQPSNSRYQAVRRFARRNDVTFVLPERVYEELTIEDTDVEEVPIDTAIDEGWATVAAPLEFSDSVRDQACQLFRSAQTEDLHRGRSIEAIAAASVYGACRCNGRSRLVDDVSEMARVAESRVTNAYKTLNEELGLPAEPVSPSMFVPRLASDLECPDEIRQRARTLAEEAEERGVTTGVHPAGFAAACLYNAGQEQEQWVTQSDVAETRNVTPTTVRTHHETLEEQIA